VPEPAQPTVAIARSRARARCLHRVRIALGRTEPGLRFPQRAPDPAAHANRTGAGYASETDGRIAG
jgi:hypothetical protein